jgi:PhoH-like ATPase
MLHIRNLDVPPDIVDSVYAEATITLQEAGPVNSYMVLRDAYNPKHTAFVQHIGEGQWRRIKNNDELMISGLRGRDARQTAFINSLVDEQILIDVVIGQAGTGKTTLALAYALDRWFHAGKRIVLSKPTAMVGEGKAFGPVPGDMDEKYAPYLASYEIAMKRLLGKHGGAQLEAMKRKEHLQYVPIELVRGSEFEDCTFILDEAQNMTWHELKTVISRMGAGTKMIIMGDLRQIDLVDRDRKPLAPEETGLYKLIHSAPYQGSPVSSQIELLTQYRSPITKLIADVDEWLAKPQVVRHSTLDEIPLSSEPCALESP